MTLDECLGPNIPEPKLRFGLEHLMWSISTIYTIQTTSGLVSLNGQGLPCSCLTIISLSWTNRKISSSLGQIAEYSTNVCQFGRGGPAQREKVHSGLNRHSLVLSHRKRESQFFKNPRDPPRCFVTYPSWFFESGIKHLPWESWAQVICIPLYPTLINAHLGFHLR